MIFFFHHYELPALLEQIRQQQQQVPAHQDQQAADGHAGPDNNADDADQSGGGRLVDTEAERQDVGVSEARRQTGDTDNLNRQLSPVNHAAQRHTADVAEHQLHVSHSIGCVEEASQQSAALTSTSIFHSTLVASDEDDDYGSCAVDTEETHVHCDLSLSPGCEATDALPSSAEDARGLASSPAVDSSMELRRRYQASSSAGPTSSERVFTSCQELCTNRPRGDQTMESAETVTESSRAEVQQNACHLLSTNLAHTE